MSEEELQELSRALTHMLFRNVPLVEEIHTKRLVIDQELMKRLIIFAKNIGFPPNIVIQCEYEVKI